VSNSSTVLKIGLIDLSLPEPDSNTSFSSLLIASLSAATVLSPTTLFQKGNNLSNCLSMS
jgi:hypothetical protein